MAILFPRPEKEFIFEERQPVEAVCPQCGSTDVEKYNLLCASGWIVTAKCQSCFLRLSEEELPIWGFWRPLTADWNK